MSSFFLIKTVYDSHVLHFFNFFYTIIERRTSQLSYIRYKSTITKQWSIKFQYLIMQCTFSYQHWYQYFFHELNRVKNIRLNITWCNEQVLTYRESHSHCLHSLVPLEKIEKIHILEIFMPTQITVFKFHKCL